jgi:hydrogenase/urease accessory protein HupE
MQSRICELSHLNQANFELGQKRRDCAGNQDPRAAELFDAYAHGTELPDGESALLYSFGFVLATGLLHLVGIAIGLIHRWSRGKGALRLAGSAVSAAGVFFIWSAV